MFVAFVLFVVAVATEEHAVNVNGGLNNLVLFGLQVCSRTLFFNPSSHPPKCWFGTGPSVPSYGWRHWARDGETSAPTPDTVVVDFLADSSEFPQTYATPMGANLYSCGDGERVREIMCSP